AAVESTRTQEVKAKRRKGFIKVTPWRSRHYEGRRREIQGGSCKDFVNNIHITFDLPGRAGCGCPAVHPAPSSAFVETPGTRVLFTCMRAGVHLMGVPSPSTHVLTIIYRTVSI